MKSTPASLEIVVEELYKAVVELKNQSADSYTSHIANKAITQYRNLKQEQDTSTPMFPGYEFDSENNQTLFEWSARLAS